MEELNEMQEPLQNVAPQPVVEDNNSESITSNAETSPVPGPTPSKVESGNLKDETSPNVAPGAATSQLPTLNSQLPAEDGAEAEPETDYSAMSREELLAAFQELLNEDVTKIRNRASAIRSQFNTLNKEVENRAFETFINEGGNKDDYQYAQDAVAEAFYNAYDTFRTRRQKMQEELEALKRRNLEAKQQILDELRQLIAKDEENIKQTYDEFNAIQDKWKTIGEVPREQMNDLWQNYHFLIEQFFTKVKMNKELRMLDLKRNLEQKIQLCERAEELIVETSVVKAFKALQDLRAQWKEIGPVPVEQNEETWQRFNNAASQIDERRHEYYDQRHDELEQNLLAKQALIAKAEELAQVQPDSTKKWNETTDAFDELLKLWKSIGPVPREQNEEIWGKFKGFIDKHYADKKLHFGQIRDEQTENYNKKIDLCLRAEAIAKREDWKKATEELLQLQAEWKAVGATSRKVSEKIWHRFRGACDEFFAKKNEYFKDIRSTESDNLTRKNAIIEEMRAYQFGDDKEQNLVAIKDFQRRWSEIGHVPMKDKDRVVKEYRGLLDGIFTQLKISAREAEETAYRERVRNAAGDTKRFVSNEKQDLLDKIEKLRADIKLWENNLGFLASSKQADLLKQEFEHKMQGTRQQIALLEAKLRILAETEAEAGKEETPDNEK